MCTQSLNEHSIETLPQQLELDLRFDDNIICTRACEGVSVSPGQVYAELRPAEEDARVVGTEVSVARLHPVPEEENPWARTDAVFALDKVVEWAVNDSRQPVMEALCDALVGAGVNEDVIAKIMEEKFDSYFEFFIEDFFDGIELLEILYSICDRILGGRLDRRRSTSSAS